jgi:hypothetical protein
MNSTTQAKIKITHVRPEGYAFATNMEDGGSEVMVSQHLISGYGLQEGDVFFAHLVSQDGKDRPRAASIVLDGRGDLMLVRVTEDAPARPEPEEDQPEEDQPEEDQPEETGPPLQQFMRSAPKAATPPTLDRAPHRAAAPAVHPTDEVPGHRDMLDSLRDIRNHAMRAVNHADVTMRELINEHGRPTGWNYTPTKAHTVSFTPPQEKHHGTT